jgi:hypothetical protein
MEATLETPTTTQVNPQDLPADFDISKWAREQDEAPETPSAAPVPTPSPEPAKPAEAAKPEPTPKPEDAKAGEQAAGKEESAFAKAQKGADRRDKSWKALEAEKQEFRQQKAATEAELAGLRREVAQLRIRANPAKDDHGVTADQYDRLAKRYDEEGNDDMAAAARERAEKLRRQAPAAMTGDGAWETPEFQKAWAEHTAELVKADATLADGANPVVKAANTLLSDQTWAPFFRARPDGIKAAVEVARLLQRAGESEAIKQKLTAAEAEVQRLSKLTQPQGSPPGAPPRGVKRIEDMADEEARAEILRVAAAADRGEA